MKNKVNMSTLMALYIPLLVIVGGIFFIFPQYRWVGSLIVVGLVFILYLVGKILPRKIFLNTVAKQPGIKLEKVSKEELKPFLKMRHKIGLRKNSVLFIMNGEMKKGMSLIRRRGGGRFYYFVDLMHPDVRKAVAKEVNRVTKGKTKSNPK